MNFNRKNGIQTLDSQPGYVYEGELFRDKKDGFGSLYIDDILTFSGNFKNDLKHGKGREFCGEVHFIGTWKEGKKHGNFFEQQGNKVFVSFYDNGELVSRENTEEFIAFGNLNPGN